MSNDRFIAGEDFTDQRGRLRFFNQFDMTEIVRFYEIAPANETIIRGWQAHEKETKWFYCLSGAFIINSIKIDNFNNPSDQLNPTKHLLKATQPHVLEIPGGYATGIKAMEVNARLQVFSNFSVEASKEDDFRYPLEQWTAVWEA